MILFTVASMACGFSPSLPALIAGRVLQGIGAAMITPTSLALFREAFHDPARRGRAIVYWDWRLIFFVNLPVGVAALLVLSRVAPSPHILLTFAICVASAAVFVAAQARGSHPMIPLDLFRSRAVSTALIVAGVTMAAFYGVVFLQSLYFQQERGASALETGLLFLPMTGLVALLNPLVARFAERFGRIVAIVSGQLLMAAGLASLCLLPGNAPTLLVAFLMVPVGVGGSFTVPPIIALILDHVPAELAGTASGAVNTARQLGGSLGVAIFGRTRRSELHGRIAHQPEYHGPSPSGPRSGVPAASARTTITALAKGRRHETRSPHPDRQSPYGEIHGRRLPQSAPQRRGALTSRGGDGPLHPRCPYELAFPPSWPDPALHRWHRVRCHPGRQCDPHARRGHGPHAPPGEEHWHGATQDNMMCHLALVEHDNGESATWLEPVSEQDYQAAHAQISR